MLTFDKIRVENRMLELDEQQQAARDWFESLRDRICATFEEIEREAGSDAAFSYIPWERTDPSGEPGGGGVRGQLNGKVFEKVGVNVSTVGGRFSPEFAASIHGAEGDPSFFATGISLVAHMANPHVPAVHMNTRFLTTAKRWFGGGADLSPLLDLEPANVYITVDRADREWTLSFEHRGGPVAIGMTVEDDRPIGHPGWAEVADSGFDLLPGERAEVAVRWSSPPDVAGRLRVSGWNVEPVVLE